MEAGRGRGELTSSEMVDASHMGHAPGTKHSPVTFHSVFKHFSLPYFCVWVGQGGTGHRSQEQCFAPTCFMPNPILST